MAKEISFIKVFLFCFYLWWPFCSAELNGLSNFGRGHHEEHFCEIILNFNKWFRRCRLNIVCLELWRLFCSAQQINLCNLHRGHYCELFSLKCIKFEAVVHEKMAFQDISLQELELPICWAEQNYLCNFVEGITRNIM